MRCRITLPCPPFFRRMKSFTDDPASSSPINTCWTVFLLTSISSTFSTKSPAISCAEFHAGDPTKHALILQPDSITPMVLRLVDFEVLDDGELGRFAGGSRHSIVIRHFVEPLDPLGRLKKDKEHSPCSVVRILSASQATSF